jgi:DNA polymerase
VGTEVLSLQKKINKMNELHKDYFSLLGIQPWQLRVSAEQAMPLVATMPERAIPACQANIASTWQDLQQTVAHCTRCALHQGRTQTVFGVGSQTASLMVIGEAPGYYEDQQGEPFVGRAGQLLTAMLKAIGFTRQQVYIANILKCRPPNNRDPLPEEVQTCTPYLDQQIALLQPRLLLAVGRVSAHYLLKTKSSLESLRNKVHPYGQAQTPLIITYHPAYLLRNPIDKKKAFQDLQFVLRTLNVIM